MLVWKFSNWPLTFFWIFKGLVILGILEMPCSKYSNFPKKTKYGLCWRRWSLRWGSGNVLTATPSALDAGWDWRSESESRWQSQIDNYNDNDLHNILSGTSSRAKDAPPAQGLFWFVASIWFLIFLLPLIFSRPGRLMGETSLWKRWLGPCLGKTFVEQITRAGNWLWSRTSAEENFVVCTKMGKCHRYKMFFVC